MFGAMRHVFMICFATLGLVLSESKQGDDGLAMPIADASSASNGSWISTVASDAAIADELVSGGDCPTSCPPGMCAGLKKCSKCSYCQEESLALGAVNLDTLLDDVSIERSAKLDQELWFADAPASAQSASNTTSNASVARVDQELRFADAPVSAQSASNTTSNTSVARFDQEQSSADNTSLAYAQNASNTSVLVGNSTVAIDLMYRLAQVALNGTLASSSNVTNATHPAASALVEKLPSNESVVLDEEHRIAVNASHNEAPCATAAPERNNSLEANSAVDVSKGVLATDSRLSNASENAVRASTDVDELTLLTSDTNAPALRGATRVSGADADTVSLKDGVTTHPHPEAAVRSSGAVSESSWSLATTLGTAAVVALVMVLLALVARIFDSRKHGGEASPDFYVVLPTLSGKPYLSI